MRTQKHLLTTLAAAAVLGVAMQTWATPCIDCPTPPPCSAEGGCYPKRNTHGYYQQTWRRWPTDHEGVRRPTDAAPGVPVTEVPPAAIEERAAPAPTAQERSEEPAQPGEGVRELDLPALPPIHGQPAAPDNGAAPGDDPPPGLPPLPGFGAPPGIAPPPRPASGPGQTRTNKRQGEDTPPPLPAGFAGLIGSGQVAPATYQSTGTAPRAAARHGKQSASPAHYHVPLR